MKSILLLFIIAVITQVLVSWAGNIMHGIGTEEIPYAVLTFSDESNLPMTTNIMINICVLNVFMFFIYGFAKEAGWYDLENRLILYIIFYYTFRYVLICWLLRRRALYNFIYEFIIAALGIGIAIFLIKIFFATEETIFITVAELREELWFIAILVMYKFITLITDKYVLQNTILTKSQKEQFLISRFNKFYKKYGDIIVVDRGNRFLCIFIFAVMIFEDYNRGPVARFLENELIRFTHKEMTLGIMQVKSKTPLSDRESVIRAYNNLSESHYEELLDGNPWNQAWEYNNDDSYANTITYIFEVLCRYIDENPKYRKVFYMRQENDEEQHFYRKVERLGRMLREGLLTEEEFESEKAKLISEIHEQ